MLIWEDCETYEEFKDEVLPRLRPQDNGTGESSYLDEVLDKCAFPEIVQYWIFWMAMEMPTNSLVITSILHTISHQEYEDLDPLLQELPKQFAMSENDRTVAYSLKCFSNWNKKEHLDFVRCLNYKEKWKQQEQNFIIQNLEKK